MHPHLDAIGFVTETLEEIPDLADRAAHAATPVEVKGGYCYLHWSGESGAELWLQLSRDSKLIGLAPHFAGKARMRVALTEPIDREDATPLDRAYYAWAEPTPGAMNRTFAIAFDCPNPLVHADLTCPTVATVQVAAFAYDAKLYPTVAEFEAAERSRGLDPDLPSFHAAGLLGTDPESLRTAEAFAMLTGTIAETGLRHNELTGEPFHWLLVECMGSTFDVVIDARAVAEPPQVGGVASGLFWCTGRILDYEKRTGFFDPTPKQGLS